MCASIEGFLLGCIEIRSVQTMIPKKIKNLMNFDKIRFLLQLRI